MENEAIGWNLQHRHSIAAPHNSAVLHLHADTHDSTSPTWTIQKQAAENSIMVSGMVSSSLMITNKIIALHILLNAQFDTHVGS